MDAKENEKPNIRMLLRDASSSFRETGLVAQARVFDVFSQRVSKLDADLHEMRKICERVKDRHLVPSERRMLKRRLRRFTEFSDGVAKAAKDDYRSLDALLLELETEVAALAPSFAVLKGIYEYPSIAYKGKRK